MKILLIIPLLAVCVANVVSVTDKTFNELVVSSDKWSLVDYYADWCRHCQQLHPIYDQLGELFKDEDKVQILRINGDTQGRKTTRKYKIDGFPMIQMYHGTDDPITYEGGRDLQSLSNFVQLVANVRLPSPEEASAESNVVALNDLNFESRVLNAEIPTIVVFTALWCGHCKKLEPIWEKLANRLYSNDLESIQIGEIKTSEVPADKLMSQFGVDSFPTILFFNPNSELDSNGLRRPKKYTGDRSIEDLVHFINTESGLHRSIYGQLDSQAGKIQRLDTLIGEKLIKQSSSVSISAAISLLKDIDELFKISISSIASKGDYIKKDDDLLMIPYYKKLVNKLINGDEEFFARELNRLKKIVTTESRNLNEKTVDSMQKRINVLTVFLESI